jgi:hypothetical protein
VAGIYQMIQLMHCGKLKRSVFKFVGDPEWMAPEVLSQVRQLAETVDDGFIIVQATTFTELVDIYRYDP